MNIGKVLVAANNLKDIYKQYCLDPKAVPVSVDDYVNYIADHEKFSITVQTLSWNSRRIRGVIHRFDEERRAEIYVAPVTEADEPYGITKCEERMVILKECSHLVIDGEESYIQFAGRLVEDIVLRNNHGGIINEFESPVQSEFLAEIFALELLFPFEMRDACMTQLKDKTTTHFEIADRFKIPEKKVIWVLESSFHTGLQSYHDAMSS